MENGLTFIFESSELRNLLNNNSTHVYIVAKLVSGKIGDKHVAVMQVQADAYAEATLPPGVLRMVKVSTNTVVGCPVPPCKDPDQPITQECITETEALLNSYKSNNFSSGFNFQ